MLGASLNDTFDGDGAAERGAAIDDGGTDVLSRPLQAIGGPDGQVELDRWPGQRPPAPLLGAAAGEPVAPRDAGRPGDATK